MNITLDIPDSLATQRAALLKIQADLADTAQGYGKNPCDPMIIKEAQCSLGCLISDVDKAIMAHVTPVVLGFAADDLTAVRTADVCSTITDQLLASTSFAFTDVLKTTSNALTLPVDSGTVENPFSCTTLTLRKLGVLVPVTQELLLKDPNLAEYLTEKATRKLAYKLNVLVDEALAQDPTLTVGDLYGAVKVHGDNDTAVTMAVELEPNIQFDRDLPGTTGTLLVRFTMRAGVAPKRLPRP